MIGRAKVISFINLKGGVGKTTTAVNVAATLADPASEKLTNKPNRVLLIDLDPQSNASLTFLSKEEYKYRDAVETEKNQTLYRLFASEIERQEGAEPFPIREIVWKNREIKTSVWSSIPNQVLNLSLIAGSLRIVDIQDQLVTFHRHYLSATDILHNALERLRDADWEPAYTHIIIDCPPSLGLTTLNALAISDFYVVPTYLDSYSHWGLDKIRTRIDRLKSVKASCRAEMLGVTYSRVDAATRVNNDRWKREFQDWISEQKIPNDDPPLVFETEIPQNDIIRTSEAAPSPLIAFGPKHAHDHNVAQLRGQWEKVQPCYYKLVKEIQERLGKKKDRLED